MSTTATIGTAQSFTLVSIERIADAISALPPDPLAKKMAADGFDPKAGGILILPAALRHQNWGPFGPPGYVRFSNLISEPIYALDPCRLPIPHQLQAPTQGPFSWRLG